MDWGPPLASLQVGYTYYLLTHLLAAAEEPNGLGATPGPPPGGLYLLTCLEFGAD